MQHTTKTYRYLRIGMIGAVVSLAASIGLENWHAGCWQTSISAYYYTPARTIFVGALIAVGLALVVYTGRTTWEDLSLNFAGMFAMVVAVAPTTDVGECWSVPPRPLPVEADGSLAPWVTAGVGNNFATLLIVAGIGLAFTVVAVVALNRDVRALLYVGRRSSRVALAATVLIVLVGWWLFEMWDDFYVQAHGYAAVLLFVFLTTAIVAVVADHRRQRSRWFWIYAVVAACMIVGAVVLPTTRIFEQHTVFALEAYEIAFFAVYWIAQTVENWNRDVARTP